MKKIFPYALNAMLAILLVYLVWATPSLHFWSPTQPRFNGYDFRGQFPNGIGLLILAPKWIGQPLPNVTATIYAKPVGSVTVDWLGQKHEEFRLIELAIITTNATGIATWPVPYIGPFYVRMEYWGYWVRGGVEIVYRWIVFDGDPSGDRLIVTWTLAPGTWPKDMFVSP